MRSGLQHIDEIVEQTPFDIYDLKKYYTLHLSYNLDERKRQGMKRFLQEISHKGMMYRLPVVTTFPVTGTGNIAINQLLLLQIYSYNEESPYNRYYRAGWCIPG